MFIYKVEDINCHIALPTMFIGIEMVKKYCGCPSLCGIYMFLDFVFYPSLFCPSSRPTKPQKVL